MKNNTYYYPLKLSYIAKETLWGGSYLYERFGKLPCGTVGESWELSVRPQEKSIILNGSCKGMSLNEYLAEHLTISDEDFPLLIKFIDAHDDLSVQVHPSDENAHMFGLKNGKTEIWYIVDAEPDSFIVHGAAPGVSLDELRDAILNGRINSALNYVKISPGDVFFIPGGMIHMIGKGTVIAEIQQNSDTTFRLYDHDRLDKNGKSRELHIDSALKSLRTFTNEEISDLAFSCRADDDMGGRILTSNSFFTVIIKSIERRESFSLLGKSFISLLCIDGDGTIYWEGGSEAVRAGDSFFIPDELGSFELDGDLKILFSFPNNVK